MEWFAGSLLHWPLTSADTDGTLALGHAVVRPGGEPPLHVHAREDETFYMLDGEITFQRGTSASMRARAMPCSCHAASSTDSRSVQ
jgi:quercetin dioxygenase-like cupin family protein